MTNHATTITPETDAWFWDEHRKALDKYATCRLSFEEMLGRIDELKAEWVKYKLANPKDPMDCPHASISAHPNGSDCTDCGAAVRMSGSGEWELDD